MPKIKKPLKISRPDGIIAAEIQQALTAYQNANVPERAIDDYEPRKKIFNLLSEIANKEDVKDFCNENEALGRQLSDALTAAQASFTAAIAAHIKVVLSRVNNEIENTEGINREVMTRWIASVRDNILTKYDFANVLENNPDLRSDALALLQKIAQENNRLITKEIDQFQIENTNRGNEAQLDISKRIENLNVDLEVVNLIRARIIESSAITDVALQNENKNLKDALSAISTDLTSKFVTNVYSQLIDIPVPKDGLAKQLAAIAAREKLVKGVFAPSTAAIYLEKNADLRQNILNIAKENVAEIKNLCEQAINNQPPFTVEGSALRTNLAKLANDVNVKTFLEKQDNQAIAKAFNEKFIAAVNHDSAAIVADIVTTLATCRQLIVTDFQAGLRGIEGILADRSAQIILANPDNAALRQELSAIYALNIQQLTLGLELAHKTLYANFSRATANEKGFLQRLRDKPEKIDSDPEYKAYSRVHENISNLLRTEILAEPDIDRRTLILERWAEVIQQSLERGNYLAAIALSLLLRSAPLDVLVSTNNGLSSHAKEIFDTASQALANATMQYEYAEHHGNNGMPHIATYQAMLIGFDSVKNETAKQHLFKRLEAAQNQAARDIQEPQPAAMQAFLSKLTNSVIPESTKEMALQLEPRLEQFKITSSRITTQSPLQTSVTALNQTMQSDKIYLSHFKKKREAKEKVNSAITALESYLKKLPDENINRRKRVIMVGILNTLKSNDVTTQDKLEFFDKILDPKSSLYEKLNQHHVSFGGMFKRIKSEETTLIIKLRDLKSQYENLQATESKTQPAIPERNPIFSDTLPIPDTQVGNDSVTASHSEPHPAEIDVLAQHKLATEKLNSANNLLKKQWQNQTPVTKDQYTEIRNLIRDVIKNIQLIPQEQRTLANDLVIVKSLGTLGNLYSQIYKQKNVDAAHGLAEKNFHKAILLTKNVIPDDKSLAKLFAQPDMNSDLLYKYSTEKIRLYYQLGEIYRASHQPEKAARCYRQIELLISGIPREVKKKFDPDNRLVVIAQKCNQRLIDTELNTITTGSTAQKLAPRKPGS